MSIRRPQPAKPAPKREDLPALSTNSSTEGLPSWLVVGIGASAGGLDACRKLLAGLPASPGISFILVQHLDPNHDSMLVELLASRSSMQVSQAVDGVRVEPNRVYVIPPGTYLALQDGALRLSQPQARHGARLPFDFLLHSLARECGPRAVALVLSGTGSDGSIGVRAIHEAGGWVIAQEPTDAGYDGMPRNAILTDCVDQVMPVADMPAALTARRAMSSGDMEQSRQSRSTAPDDSLQGIVELLRAKTAHDFRLYKPGTLQRRCERRMTIASVDSLEDYFEMLRRTPHELDLLARDLLINVTSFFRDPEVFEHLAEKAIPAMLNDHPADLPIRLWVAGCSTGEETYSLAILFREAITAAQLNLKLQIFASDVDAEAVAVARDGLYPESIAADVAPSRLARFFTKEDRYFRVVPELRSHVVFTVQDLLSDPPFSRLDMVSCRNVLIYLLPEAQAKIIALFHFSLLPGGLLLLGSSETIGPDNERFALLSKSARLYRHVERSRPGELELTMGYGEAARYQVMPRPTAQATRQTVLADLCRRQLLDHYAPVAVLINRRHECQYSLGAVDRYLRVPPGPPSQDLLAMARPELRTKLRSAIQQASQSDALVTLVGEQLDRDGTAMGYRIEILPVHCEGETFLLICFIDQPLSTSRPEPAVTEGDQPQVAELKRELRMVRAELQAAIRNLELSNEDQKAINEESLSVNEEFQSTNEELLTSKEELQSLNEELTALNNQLQETLDRQRVTSTDLQNVLYSTNVATLFLDMHLNIRFFTPATRTLFNVIAGDVGRPLADLRSLATDPLVLTDAALVLQTRASVEREIEGADRTWYIRRVLPYRSQDDGVEGVVITYADITDRRQIAEALEAAKRQAELANLAKSRFLAAASHDLRQPLQTLSLLQGLLARTVVDEKGQRFVARLGETLGAMSGMLNTLLDINQIEAGTVHADIVRFPLHDLLNRLTDEFSYHAAAQGLILRSVPCSAEIDSDPRLLEQMVRNLLANALKYTNNGKVLLGCRRYGTKLRIEVWDTGIGIPLEEQKAIFEEYHQIDNAARERSRGMGLGLSIVQRLGKLLGHEVTVCSKPMVGSGFGIMVPLPIAAEGTLGKARSGEFVPAPTGRQRQGLILLVEDDPEIREMLELLLQQEGHAVVAAIDGPSALIAVQRDGLRPDLLLADFNLPNGLNGLELTAVLRCGNSSEIPVIILTGDISTGTLREIAAHKCIQMNKPVKAKDLIDIVTSLIPRATPPAAIAAISAPARPEQQDGPVIYVVDDDNNVRDVLCALLREDGHQVQDFASCEAFLESYQPGHEGCLLLDATLPGMQGLELLRHLQEAGKMLPSIMITGNSDVPMAVSAMKAGATDFIEKPVGREELLAGITRALEQSKDSSKVSAWQAEAESRLASLTPRQIEIMRMVLAGNPSKNIAADLGISQRTVENHRASIMDKTGSKSLPALARLALAAQKSAAPGINGLQS